MNINEIQQQLFQLIKAKLPTDVSMADEVAKLLNISGDSAYRRMRGEKLITFEELYLLCNNWRISLDKLMQIQSEGLIFQGNFLNPRTHRYDAYLTGLVNNLSLMNSFKKKEFYYLCKDTPIFHYFNIPELASFKYFFWMATLIYFPEFRTRRFSFDEYPEEIEKLGKKCLSLYNQIDSFEVWNIESLNTTIHQVEYYRNSQTFRSDEDALRIYEAVERVIGHLEAQASLGYKFDINDPEKKQLGKYNVYFNEIVLQDNSMMAVLDNSRMAFLPHTAINYLMTRDVAYCDNYQYYVQNLIKRSTLISEVSEKERSSFFRRIRERIERRKELLRV